MLYLQERRRRFKREDEDEDISSVIVVVCICVCVCVCVCLETHFTCWGSIHCIRYLEYKRKSGVCRSSLGHIAGCESEASRGLSIIGDTMTIEILGCRVMT